MKRILYLLVLYISAASVLQAGNLMYLGLGEVKSNGTQELTVYLNNDTECYGFQTDITLPVGMEFVIGNGNQVTAILNERSSGFSLVTNIVSTQQLNVGAFSMNHSQLTGNSGGILTLTIKRLNNFTGGMITLSNGHMVKRGDIDILLPDFTIKVNAIGPNNYFTMPGVTILAGGSKQIELYLNNTDEITAFQVDFLLPQNLSIKEGSFSLMERDAYHSLAVSNLGNGNYRMVVTSTENLSFSGQDGPVISFVLETENNTSPGIYSILVSNVVISTTSGVELKLENIIGIITVVKEIPVESVNLNKSTFTGREGTTVQLTATVSPANAKDKTVTWSTSNAKVATVTNNGLVLLVGTGTAEITARCGNASSTCQITVQPPLAEGISVTPVSGTIKENNTLQLNAVITPANAAFTLSWNSSNPAIATVSETGLVKGINVGTANITVRTDNGLEATCRINVLTNIVEVNSVILDQATYTGREGTTIQLTAIVSPENATDKTLTWSSSDTKIASVSDSGLVSLLSPGTSTITVTTSNGMNAQCFVTVYTDQPIVVEVSGIQLNSQEVTLKEGDLFHLTATVYPENATNKNITWTSSDRNVITVENGVVKGISPGEASVYATANNGVSASCHFVVLDKEAEIIFVERIEISETEIIGEEGFVFTLQATVYPENATNKSVVWESSDEDVVIISQTGRGKILSGGKAIITVYAADGSGTMTECLITGYAGIESMLANPDCKISVYSLDGVLIKKECMLNDLKSLIKGIYIIVLGEKRYKFSI